LREKIEKGRKMSNFKERLENLVKESGLSLLALEKKIGISNAQLGKYIAGYYEPSLKNAIIIADGFSCSLDYLFCLDSMRNRFLIKRPCNPELFAQRFSLLKEKFGTNDNRISKELNITRHCLRRWGKNSTFPNMSVLVKLAEYFNVSLEYLVGRVD